MTGEADSRWVSVVRPWELKAQSAQSFTQRRAPYRPDHARPLRHSQSRIRPSAEV